MSTPSQCIFRMTQPFLKVLNGGKASQSASKSVNLFAQAAANSKVAAQTPQNGQAVEKAAEELYKFLSKKDSALRAFAEIASQGGCFYSGYVADKLA